MCFSCRLVNKLNYFLINVLLGVQFDKENNASKILKQCLAQQLSTRKQLLQLSTRKQLSCRNVDFVLFAIFLRGFING